MSYNLNPYQQKIIEAYKTTSDNLYISAKAGTGKTFTLLELSKHFEGRSLFLAFNKSIQQEISQKVQGRENFKVYTFNALGYMILQRNNDGKRQLKIDQFKTYSIAHSIISEKLKKENRGKIDYFQLVYLKDNISKLYDLARARFVEMNNEDSLLDIIKNYELFAEEMPDNVSWYMQEIEKESIRMYEEDGIIDFTDQVYLVNKYILDKDKDFKTPGYLLFDNICVDEAQDLSRMQQLFLNFIRRKGGRYIFCLDEKQAIYSFAGADSKSYETIKRLFKPVELNLPINYRCAKSHLNLINKIYDIGILPHDNAIVGNIIKSKYEDMADLAQVGDFVIARKNKELCEVVLDLLKANKPIYVKDADLVKKIVTFIKKTKTDNVGDLRTKMNRARVKMIRELEAQKKKIEEEGIFDTEKIQESQTSNSTMDIFEATFVLLENYSKTNTGLNINCFIEYIENMLNTTNPSGCVLCSSIHQIKGLEADNVFLVGSLPCYSLARTADQLQQEKNLHYIALSRARKNLYLVKGKNNEQQ